MSGCQRVDDFVGGCVEISITRNSVGSSSSFYEQSKHTTFLRYLYKEVLTSKRQVLSHFIWINLYGVGNANLVSIKYSNRRSIHENTKILWGNETRDVDVLASR
ncbi:uncharacterized protein PHALS_00917 [Plasmopara halstedii]|uniref:Uncharacterized protein n=1 Tax=Plasmopara halstedii TaxID=4781 RepID=A0A0P1AV75_PLAHL|nr:uncharacterized protein PHALS_00917 [Plasmopara halstedii]CEG44566.1 hypothetical protein PHALS_00917 [Plasmopara halstedii]|eukprot:XP_024580935.1 hypothetical protein PHALS_00917 [Plasmopara halstedii]